jgi:hypothetical protein
MLLKQSKESEKEVEQITVVKQEEVEKGMADKIRIMRELIAEQDGMVFINIWEEGVTKLYNCSIFKCKLLPDQKNKY